MHHTLVSVARQRPGLDGPRCRALLALLAVAEQLGLRLWPRERSGSLSELQFVVMVVLFATHPVAGTPAGLADHAGCARSTVSGTLRQLEQRGWLEWRRVGRDRRTRQVQLTAAGFAAVDRRMGQLLSFMSASTEGLGDAEVAQLAELCERVLWRLEQHPTPVS